MKFFSGDRPDITPAMVAAFLIAGIPVIANLLQVFGLYDLSKEQEKALQDTIQWAIIGGVGLIAGDSYLRGKRNEHDATVTAAMLTPTSPTAVVATDGGTAVSNPPAAPALAAAGVQSNGTTYSEPEGAPPAEDGLDDEEALPSDEEEFASPPEPNIAATAKPDKP